MGREGSDEGLEAYLESERLGCLVGKCPLVSTIGKGMSGMHIWQIHHGEVYLASA